MTKGSSSLRILLICAYAEPIQASIPATIKLTTTTRVLSSRGVALAAVSGVEPIEAFLDHGDLLIDLTDWQAEVVASSPLEVDGQLLTMHPKIFEGPSVA
jgi:hypothetical protein